MKLHYYPDTDSLCIDFGSKHSAESQEIREGVEIDFDKEGNITGVDIQHASGKLDLTSMETIAIPTPITKIAS